MVGLPANPTLPTNIDASYSDSGTDATVKLHQQMHDTIGGVLNGIYLANIGTTRTAAFTITQNMTSEFVPVNASTSITITVPTLQVGTSVEFWAQGAGLFTLAASGVTLQPATGSGTAPRVRYSSVALLWVTTTLVYVSGDVA